MLPTLEPGGEALHPVVDAGVEAEGQAVAGGVDRVDHAVEVGRAEGRDVEDGAEDLAPEVGDAVHAEDRGAEEGALPRRVERGDQAAFAAGGLHMGGDVVAGGLA